MTEKYRVINGFDYKNEPCKLIEYIETEERYSTENDLEANSLCKLLNEQEETIQTQKDYIIRMGHGTIFEEMKRLKERNQRQYERLNEITNLMFKRDWKTLETMVDEWEQAEEQLEREWGTYGGDRND